MEERDGILVLVDEDNNEYEFEFLDSIEDNGKRYVVLVPVSDDEGEEEVLIMRVVTDDSDEDALEAIEDEAELDRVFEIFKENNGEEFDFVD